MKLFTLYIGSTPRSASSVKITPARIQELIAKRFESFTILPASGVFRRQEETTHLVQVTPLDVLAFLDEVELLRGELDQNGIGIEHRGNYVRVADGSNRSSVLRQLYPRIRPEYLEAVFETELPHGGWPESFAVITGRNRDGRHETDARNEELDAALAEHCTRAGLPVWRATGGSADFSHAEPGFGVETDLPTALGIGRLFQQEAIFHVLNGELSLHACEGSDEVPLGRWEARLRKTPTAKVRTPNVAHDLSSFKTPNTDSLP